MSDEYEDKSRGASPYTVGYGKPPRATRFKKGQSGNPSGRPRKLPDVDDLIAKVVSEKVVGNENGRRRRFSKLEIGVKTLVNDYCKGDRHAAKAVFESLGRTTARRKTDAATVIEDSTFNRELLEDLIARRVELPGEDKS